MTDYRQHQPAPLATGPRNMALLSFHDAREQPEDARFEDAPMGYALVVLWHGDRVLMVYERERECWELPGGGIEPGESPRAAAVRELWEETGQPLEADAMRFVGHTCTALGTSGRVLYGGVFTARTDRPRTFAPNSEVSAVHWRADGEPFPGGGMVQTVDEYIVELCRD
ncbi:NUDIX hydrolase [Streptomyces abyssalis]|uniref:NUDIX hydrolase n=1 Tax=Streptomyces abyssalis TaxID=933944 RepID=UPI00085BB99B|nr:NUDIX hydrolase [Streptomyces abyssalis]